MTYTTTTAKGSETFATIGNAVRATAQPAFKEAAFGYTITNDGTGESVSFDLVGDDAIAVEDVQALFRLTGCDPRENEPDGFHWPYSPTVREVGQALDRWTQER